MILEMLSVLVIVLNTIPFVLPVVLSESYVVSEASHKEITASNSVIDGKPSGVSDGIGVWRKLSAFEEESTGFRAVD
jgi:hypothetical protein